MSYPSASVNTSTSGLRRSPRSQITPSPTRNPDTNRKSRRLENQVLEKQTPSPLKRKGSPLSSKPGSERNGKRGLRNLEVSKKDKVGDEGEDDDDMSGKTLKEIAKEVRGSSPSTGEKTKKKNKKRLNARQFKAMFDLSNPRLSETKSKKRKLENFYENIDSGLGESVDKISKIGGNNVDTGHVKFEGLQAKSNEIGDNDGNTVEKLQENYDEVVDGGVEELDEEPQKSSVGEGIEEQCATKNGLQKGFCVEQHCERVEGEGGLVSESAKVPSSGCVLQVEKNSMNGLVGEVNGSVAGNLENQDIDSDSGKAVDNGHLSMCNRKMLTTGEFVARGYGIGIDMKVIPSAPPTCKMGSLPEECARCSNKPRSQYESSKQKTCTCVSNPTSGAKLISASKDREECSNTKDGVSHETSRSGVPIDANQDLCHSCKRPGNLLRCSGKACRRSCHSCCLQTHEGNPCIPFWYCSKCTKKKLALGSHSVSEGIESILVAREVQLSSSEGSLKEKQYFVKYKCLAHIHNCWISETQLLHEAPEFDTTLVNQAENTSWNPEWAVPHRLLSRRSVTVENQDAGFPSNSHREWLVKWRCMDYDQATWEMEDSAIFQEPEVQQLMQDYETRHNDARSSFIPGDDKVQERIKMPHVKSGRFLDSYRAEFVNKLIDFYQKRHHAVLLNEQDRTMKIIYFISSILCSVRRPLLIITRQESLSYWESEFVRFAASVNVVVYCGNSDSRNIIRNVEFYAEDGEVMLQVLLSSTEGISEDLEHIKGIDWEVIIVDDCQEHSILESYGCIKTLATSWKLLLLNTWLKDTDAEYINILSLLEPVGRSNNRHELMDASTGDIIALKERLCSFIISPRFQEYWVPVQISDVQLEQFCSLMLSNSTVLGLCSKSDPMGSLHDILISMQKCCDHPYLVNPSLRKSLLPENHSQEAALDMGVKASGKLQLLDKLLSEFRNQGLKVVILFQSIGGYGKDNLEFLLDDFLTWRFGKDCFEYVAVGGQPSKKHAALNKFNKQSDISFLLLETRACLPSIKLSLVHSVIILNSDWNPLNDLRALQKILIDSKLNPIKVFRFYSSCTIEEKALILAKSDMILDNTLPMNPITKQTLLMWGSSYLFSRLNEFHHDKVAPGSSLMTDVFQEIVSLFNNNGNTKPTRYISAARLDGRCYVKNTLLLGERGNQLEEGMLPYTFWMKLLGGKHPQWKYLSLSAERSKKRVDYSDDFSLSPDVDAYEQVKKHKDSSPQQPGQHVEKVNERNTEHQGHPDTSLSTQDDIHDRSGLHDQRSLHEMLKPTVVTLCETLMLKAEVKNLAERFLEYVLNNHRVAREPNTILQALQISVCWSAAEVLEQNIEHRKSLDIAMQNMDFKCLEQEADSVYRKIKLLMKIFLSRNLKILKPTGGPASATDDVTSIVNKTCVNISIASEEKEKDGLEGAEKAQNHCEKKIQKLQERQNDEVINFENFWQEKRAELEDSCKVDSALIRYSYAKSNAGVEKLKILENDFAKKREDLVSHISSQRKKLEAKQQEERDVEQKTKAQLSNILKPVHNSIQLQTSENIEQSCNGEAFETHSPSLSLGNMQNHLNVDGTKTTDRIDAEKSAPGCDMDNTFSTSLCHVSTVSTSTKNPNADRTACQDCGDELCQQRDESVEEQVHHSESCNTAPGGETSLLDLSNSVLSTLPYAEGTCGLPAIEPSPVMDVVHSCGYDQNRFSSNSRLSNQPNEVQMVVQNSFSLMQQRIPQPEVARAVNGHTDQGVFYHSALRGPCPTNTSRPNTVALRTPIISQVPSSYHSDPLQVEFDRIQKQIGQISIAHEEMKLRLKTECDEEIEEFVAQIRRKYYAKLEEAESSFFLKKNELELNHSMVAMNKFLADAYRTKCMDYKEGVAGDAESQKGKSSSLIELSLEQLMTSPFSATASYSVPSSAASFSLSSTPTPVCGVHPPPMLSSSLPTRSLHVRHEICAQAPNLHRSSLNSTALPSQAPSKYHSDFSARPIPMLPLQPRSQPPAFRSTLGPSPQLNAFERGPASSMSATELLMEIARQNNTNLCHLTLNNLPPGPNNTRDHEPCEISQFGRAVDVQPPVGVVCLSDDD